MTARRAGRRWLDGDCPAGVLAIFDNGGETFDRYTVLYVPDPADPDTVHYLGASAHPYAPQGFGQHGDMPRHAAAAYRYQETGRRHSCRWSDLPADVQRAVRADMPHPADCAYCAAGEPMRHNYESDNR